MVRKILLSVVILIVLIMAAGTIYVLLADGKVKPRPVDVNTNNDDTPAIVKPVAPGANDAEGVSVETLTSPVAAGSNASLSASTDAGSNCNIVVSYNGVISTDSGLAPKNSDAYGTVSWTWTVASTVPVGTWPIKVTCAYHGRSGVVDDSIQVTK
jgi:hypothetical protein